MKPDRIERLVSWLWTGAILVGVGSAGGTLKDVVALRIYVVDYQAECGTAVGIALREFFSAENPPASTWIGVSALAVPEFLIEIEATAVLE